MAENKHTVSTDALATLGTILDETAARDAIHLAVEPIVAGEYLHRGQHVAIDESGKAVPAETRRADGLPRLKGVGIVDPFLNALQVQPGDRFWLIVYPRTITSLRHVWSHPAFPDLGARPIVDPDRKARSEAWLREFMSATRFPDDYEELIDAAVEHQAGGGDDTTYLSYFGREYNAEIDPTFWDHVENVTGLVMKRRAMWFSCHC